MGHIVAHLASVTHALRKGNQNGSNPMIAVLIAGIGLVAVFCAINYALDQIEHALDDAFNQGDKQ